ncbi:MAG: hypothetical protein CMP23_00230 [Rickettsiales bacterium]|nr:hypothetical protein [Rickettsiales bacterium]
MTTISPRELHCPLCATRFAGHSVLAGRASGPLSSDLRRYPEGPDPIPLQLNSCPECGYSGEVSAFEEFAPEPELEVAEEELSLAELVRSRLSPKAQEAHADPALRYEQHAVLEGWLGRGPLRQGDAWLRAAWMHDDASRPQEALRCRDQALSHYRRGLDERRWLRRREDMVVVAYLVGELSRRLGREEAALRWYEQSIAWSSGLQHMQDLVELAERQAREPRDLVR